MYNRILSSYFPKGSFFLFGPRQVGKSTLIEELPQVFTLNLLDPAKQLEYSKDPNLLHRELSQLPSQKTGSNWIVIDEIQRVPALLDVVQMMMRQFSFVLSGSSARKLKRGAANLLGGRAVVRTLHPLTYAELGNDFALNKVLEYGTLPKIYSTLLEGNESYAQDLLKSYVVTYLSEEIKAEALVRNLQGFQSFLDVAAAQFGEQVNFKKMERDCKVAYTTIRDYYSILEDTLIGFFLPPYLKSKRKRMSHAPKFYFFDNGVARAILGIHRMSASPFERGRLLEQWFIQELMRINAYFQKEWVFSFWRTSHGAEVDLLVERGRELLFAIEIKSSRTISSADLSGIGSLRQSFPKLPCFVAAMVDSPQKLETVEVFPYVALLEKLKTASF